MSTYRVYKDNNGNVLKKEKVYVSYYPKKQEVVAVGTMENNIAEEKPTIPVIEEQITPSEEDTPSNENDASNDTIIDQTAPVQPSVEN